MRPLKKSLIIFAAVSALTGMAPVSGQAAIFMDFDSPPFTADGPGDNPHTFTTGNGNINFNGQITNTLNGVVTPDHTPGTGNFLKNTTAVDALTMTFDFDVASVSLWLREKAPDIIVGILSFGGSSSVFGQVYDVNNFLIDSGTLDAATGVWTFNSTEPSAPIRKIVLSSTSGTGDNFAIDDISVNPVPEPASLILMATGLAGLRLKKKLS